MSNQSGIAASPPEERASSLRARRPFKRDRVAHALREIITQLPAGERLPSVTALQSRFAVASATVEAAVALLRREGLVESRAGSGTYVRPDRPALAPTIVPVTSARNGAVSPVIFTFARISGAFARAISVQLVAQARQKGVGVECRFIDATLTPDDVRDVQLRYHGMLGFEGFLVMGGDMDWIGQILHDAGERVVVVSEPPAGTTPTVPTVHSDAEQGGYLATNHLIAHYHDRIGYAHRLPEGQLPHKSRWHGHLRALREAGLPTENADGEAINAETMWAWLEDPARCRASMERPDAPTAFAVWSDSVGIALSGTLKKAGYRVPEEVSIVGYDNLPESQYASPPLDTVDQHTDSLIRHALLLLTQPERTGVLPTTSLVVPTLIRRGSVCPPPYRTEGEEPALAI